MDRWSVVGFKCGYINRRHSSTHKLGVKVNRITDSLHPEFIVQEHFHEIPRTTERFKETDGCYEISNRNCHLVEVEDINSA
jgi:hypothetical protein